MRTALLFLASLGLVEGAVVLDRIAVVVGKSVIKLSDIDRDLRLTEFLNRQPLSLTAEARKKAAERLIDQQLIRTEIATGSYSRASDGDAEAMVTRLQRDRFGSVAARMSAELERYGLTRAQLRQEFLWQLTVLRFIQQRFQPGVVIADEDIHTYYNAHLAELQRENPKNSSFTALEPKIRDLLTGEDVNKEFETWLTRARQRTTIDYHQEAFQ